MTASEVSTIRADDIASVVAFAELGEPYRTAP